MTTHDQAIAVRDSLSPAGREAFLAAYWANGSRESLAALVRAVQAEVVAERDALRDLTAQRLDAAIQRLIDEGEAITGEAMARILARLDGKETTR